MTNNPGATPEQWINYDLMLGLTKDLLPVVSNLTAKISPKSSLKTLGKVPSLYNGDGGVVGISKWTTKQSTAADIEKWSKNPDYGICIQTREIRAIDIDVEEPILVEQILFCLNQYALTVLKDRFPIRYRENSSKCLIALRVEGEFPKKVIKVDGGVIELLANGQQFIAEGTHPSGERYKWVDDYKEPPTVTEEQYARIVEILTEFFAIEPPSEGSIRKRGENLNLHDPVSEQLDIISQGPDGQLNIVCPFAEGHTTDSGESSTSYLPAGTEGHKQGHFKCFHANCADKTDEDFMEALSLAQCTFEPIPAPAKGEPGDQPVLARNRNGQPLATIQNIRRLVRRVDLTRIVICNDAYKEEILICRLED